MFEKLLADTVDKVLKGDGEMSAIEEFQAFLDSNGWPMGYAKSTFHDAMANIIEEELPDDPEGALLDMVLGQTRSAIKLKESQRVVLKKMVELVNSSERRKCEHGHKHLGIAPFMHGGGFCPPYTMPEVICTACGLNVTLYYPKSIAEFKKDFGLDVTKAQLKELMEWANSCRGIVSSSDILRDPIGAYNRSKHRWEKKIPFRIVNRKKFESKSGH